MRSRILWNFRSKRTVLFRHIKQIQEQIKLSIAMGVLKRGDILPSIREVEKQTGINRGQIHRAYLALHTVWPAFPGTWQEDRGCHIRCGAGLN